MDAQMPRRMVRWLAAAGCDAVHTLDLPAGNRTTDAEICEFAEREKRVVVTKDADFVDSQYPPRPARKAPADLYGELQQFRVGGVDAASHPVDRSRVPHIRFPGTRLVGACRPRVGIRLNHWPVISDGGPAAE